jgi:hypothetical protein
MRVGRVTSGNWTEEMDSLLRELMARKATKKEIMVAFPSKTYDALYRRMYKLRIEAEHLAAPTKRGTPRPELRKFHPEEKERNCLTCGQRFMSTGPGNRLCITHRRESDDGTFSVKGR